MLWGVTASDKSGHRISISALYGISAVDIVTEEANGLQWWKTRQHAAQHDESSSPGQITDPVLNIVMYYSIYCTYFANIFAKTNLSAKPFFLFIRSPGGLDSWENDKKSRETATLRKQNIKIGKLTKENYHWKIHFLHYNTFCIMCILVYMWYI